MTKQNGGMRPLKPKRKWKSSLLRIFFFLFIIIAGIGFGFIGAMMQNLPNVNDVQQAASSQIYDVDGKLISTIHASENRIPVTLEDTPKVLQNAFIAAEDVRFYSHHGIDPKGIMRAIWTNVTHQGIAQGGSTITQQLARNAFLNQDQTLQRKIKEALLALKIEQTYTKPQILEMYMNQIYFGQGAYGVEAAAKTYFGTSAKQLTLAQSALIAGLPNSPNYLNPFHNLKAAKERQAVVLDQMAKYGYITETDAEEAKTEDIHLLTSPASRSENDIYAYFVDYVVQQVTERYGAEAVYKGGLKIYTTLSSKAQQAAVEAMKHLPDFYKDQNGLIQPQGALVSINPHTGYIVAMVGGRGTDYFNRAVLAERQPGSAFKPFVYLTAIQQGMTPGTLMDDKEVAYNTYKPQNYDRTFSGKVTLRYALTHSINTVAVQLADRVGMINVLENAKKMGLTTLVTEGHPNDDNLAAALGGLTKGVTPLQMASAYGVLANGGVRVTPVAITKIVDRSGQVLEENSLEESQVISPKDAYILTNMLESVIAQGTGGGAYFGRPAAGKTGTTDDSKDAWFVGYTPNLSTAVWIGDDFGSETLHGITGGTVPATIWRDYMSKTLSDMPISSFVVPNGVQDIVKQGYQLPIKDTKDKDKDKDKKNKSEKEKTTDGKTTGNTIIPNVGKALKVVSESL